MSNEMGSVQSMDTLPGMNSTDLSLASTVIPADLFNSIVSQITQIDLSLFGMNSHCRDFSKGLH